MTQDTKPPLGVSRRQVLAGLGTIGVASAGAGLGTTALFSDEESVSATVQAGELDLLLDYRATYRPDVNLAAAEEMVDGTVLLDPGVDGSFVVGQAPDFRDDEDGSVIPGQLWADVTDRADACVFADRSDIRTEFNGTLLADFLGVEVDGTPTVDDGFLPGYVDGATGVPFVLTDVKPKDYGEATISIHLCGNPAVVGVTPEITTDEEGEVYEPETSTGFADDDTAGELANYLHVRVWRDDDCDNSYDSAEEDLIYQGSLAGLVDVIAAAPEDQFVDGLRLGATPGREDECLDPGVVCVGFEWYFVCDGADFDLPSDVPDAATIGDELDAAGLPRDPNVAQTDELAFTLTFNAVQCRHLMAAGGEVLENTNSPETL